MSLEGKTVAIIGGASGIGLHVALMAAKKGANLMLIGRNPGRLADAKKTLSLLHSDVSLHQVDAHDHQALTAFFSQQGKFDHLVSMVGDVMGGGFMEAEMETIEHVIHSKFMTNVLIGKLAAPHLNTGGSMVFTSGTGGRAQHACASYVGNLGINALVEGLAAELAPAVRVNAVAPTWTLTPFWRDVPADDLARTQAHFEENIPLKRLATMDELAAAYIFLMENGFVTGQRLAVDGGIMLG
ncbi:MULTISPECIES: SDR family NAD(P)-dependent oxidoreductase [Mangrovibacter]|uniref:NAD(P)-dependent dehydrogenase (Short-subunit alcohol dehydrogenase family) n=1 Tax=Mangrovibacter plantisponsor TaxID=451513 RepID=A0A317PW36_9ENTR|nr:MULTISPECIES: SDR family oxidoreductase [Mangrovibacter]KEA50282.1 short-chain dehydrogenase [Mangrovibacter sp. MFB070]PWW05401.1 NAD(P)-dependent dehydrogenase (short-subunit alcohol dehydrogenase family) [Mangrovibacter plantisponsor]